MICDTGTKILTCAIENWRVSIVPYETKAKINGIKELKIEKPMSSQHSINSPVIREGSRRATAVYCTMERICEKFILSLQTEGVIDRRSSD